MKLDIKLSDGSISNAISRMMRLQSDFQYGVTSTVELLTQNGATLAQITYGSMASVNDSMVSPTEGVISADGETVLIAEFGAGDATTPVMFENQPNTPVYPGSYSELEGSGEYYMTGRWHFGGRTYTEVEPKAGLYKAKEYIKKESTNIAKGVIKL